MHDLPPLSAGRTPGPPPWAGQKNPASGLRRRPPGPRPVLPVPPGTRVYVIPSRVTEYQRKGRPFTATGTTALARVRDLLTRETGDPTAELRAVRTFQSWAERHGWFVVIVWPDGSTSEDDRPWDSKARTDRTSPFWHDLAALAHAPDVDEVSAARLERARVEKEARDVERAARAARVAAHRTPPTCTP